MKIKKVQFNVVRFVFVNILCDSLWLTKNCPVTFLIKKIAYIFLNYIIKVRLSQVEWNVFKNQLFSKLFITCQRGYN